METLSIFTVGSPLTLIAVMAAFSAAVLTWYTGHAAIELTYVTLADGRRRERPLPLVFRLLMPWTVKTTTLTDRLFGRSKSVFQQKLVTAGYDTVLPVDKFLGMKFLMPLAMGPVFCLLLHLAFQVLPGKMGLALQMREPYFFVIVIMLCYAYPGAWLVGRVKARHRSIERALPFVLDLLTLSVEAGLDLLSALRRIVEGRKIDALSEELIRVFREIQVGKTRREALQAMSRRVDHHDMRSLVNAMSQADELGVSMGTILRIQSEQIRVRRFQRAEKLANEAPVKMLFPLVCFIFPAVFLVMMGPIVLEMLKQGVV